MNSIPRIERLGLFVPAGFITFAAALVALVITSRSWQYEKETREAQKAAIESHVLSESTKIAEEVYLKLDNWSARERQVETYFQGHGAKTTLRFEPPQSNAGAPRDRQIMRWESDDNGEEHLVAPLYFSDLFVGTMFVDVSWGSAWSFGGIGNLTAALLAPLGAVIVLWLITALILRRKVIGPLLQRTVQLNRLEAISETTQMIAHDVKKPFHMLRMSLQAIRKAATATDVRRLTEELAPTIEKISAEVDDMLRDIVDLEKPQGLQIIETSLAGLVESLVAEHSTRQQEAEAVVDVSLTHEHFVSVDRSKIQRVLFNLLQNAFQAVNRNGSVWIETSERTSRKCGREVVVCIGNTGPAIPTADIARLFDRFFTKGKENGTGLGLAIAKKFVNAHGGEIWCHSDLDEGTRFYFSIPAGTTSEDLDLPRRYSAPSNTPVGSEKPPKTMRSGPVDRPQGASSPKDNLAPRVAIVSDNVFFRDGLRALLETMPDFRTFHVDTFANEVAEDAELDLVNLRVVIVDLEDEDDAAAVQSWIRRLAGKTRLCIHCRSNTSSFFDSDLDCVQLSTPIEAAQIERLLSSPSL